MITETGLHVEYPLGRAESVEIGQFRCCTSSALHTVGPRALASVAQQVNSVIASRRLPCLPCLDEIACPACNVTANTTLATVVS